MAKEKKPKKSKITPKKRANEIVLTETEDDILLSSGGNLGELKEEIKKDSERSDMLSRFLIPLFTFFFITLLASLATWYYAGPERQTEIPKEEKIQTPPEVKDDEEAQQEEEAPSTENEESEKRETSYTVQEGDTLSTIANANNLTSQELASHNGITDPNSLKIGQVIKIPVK